MATCSFCNSIEDEQTPVCQSCGALRYPIASNATKKISGQDKLKYSAIAAIAIFTPGSLIVLALVGVKRFSSKNKLG